MDSITSEYILLILISPAEINIICPNGCWAVWPKTGFCCKVRSCVFCNGLYGLVLIKEEL